MGAGPHRSPLVLSVEGLVALLDFLDKPAAVVGAAGRVLGANQNFGEFLSRRGIAARDRLSAFLTAGDCEWVISGAAGADSQPGQRAGRLTFRGGEMHDVRTEVFSAGPEGLVTLLVVTPPETEPGGAALRASASLRHDIAGPLTAILGAAELLLLRGEGLAPEIRRSLTSILESCGKISEILQRSRREDRPAAGTPA